MPKQEKTTATPEVKEKKSRTVLSPAERIAKAKAELEALEAKEKAKATAKVDAKQAELDKLKAKREDLDTKILGVEAELVQLKELAGITPTEG